MGASAIALQLLLRNFSTRFASPPARSSLHTASLTRWFWAYLQVRVPYTLWSCGSRTGHTPASKFTSPARRWRKIEHVTYGTPKQTSCYIYFHQHTPWCSPDSRPHHLPPANTTYLCTLELDFSRVHLPPQALSSKGSSRSSHTSHHRCRPPYIVFGLPILANTNKECGQQTLLHALLRI